MSDFLPEETGMTDYQFKRFEELKDKCEALERENERLRGGQQEQSVIGMSDYQFKILLAALCQNIKANVDAGKSPQEILTAVEAFMDAGT